VARWPRRFAKWPPRSGHCVLPPLDLPRPAPKAASRLPEPGAALAGEAAPSSRSSGSGCSTVAEAGLLRLRGDRWGAACGGGTGGDGAVTTGPDAARALFNPIPSRGSLAGLDGALPRVRARSGASANQSAHARLRGPIASALMRPDAARAPLNPTRREVSRPALRSGARPCLGSRSCFTIPLMHRSEASRARFAAMRVHVRRSFSP